MTETITCILAKSGFHEKPIGLLYLVLHSGSVWILYIVSVMFCRKKQCVLGSAIILAFCSIMVCGRYLQQHRWVKLSVFALQAVTKDFNYSLWQTPDCNKEFKIVKGWKQAFFGKLKNSRRIKWLSNSKAHATTNIWFTPLLNVSTSLDNTKYISQMTWNLAESDESCNVKYFVHTTSSKFFKTTFIKI